MIRRLGLTLVFALLATTAVAQSGSVMPVPRQQLLDSNGNPCNLCKLYTFAAGTTTPLSTYSDVLLMTLNPNPIILNTAGRPSVSGNEVNVYLTANSYKFRLDSSADVTIWTADNVTATHAGLTGVTNTGDIVFQVDTNNDGTNLFSFVNGVGTEVASLNESGNLQIDGSLTVGTTPIVTVTGGAASVRGQGSCDVRLTLTSGTPVTTGDVSAASTVYATPFAPTGGPAYCTFYDGSASWFAVPIVEVAIALGTLTSGLPYDVFCFNNAGAFACDAPVAWTNGTTRATAITLQHGVYVKAGTTTRRYVGTFYTTSTTTTEDSFAKRLLWNYYNRAPRVLRVLEATDTWVYSTATLRQANGAVANQLAVVVGVAEDPITIEVVGSASSDAITDQFLVAIGEDSTTTMKVGTIAARVSAFVANLLGAPRASLHTSPAVGYHFYAWLEYAGAVGTTTWRGDAGGPTIHQTGIHGSIRN